MSCGNQRAVSLTPVSSAPHVSVPSTASHHRFGLGTRVRSTHSQIHLHVMTSVQAPPPRQHLGRNCFWDKGRIAGPRS